jgi:hypothetical protein
MVVTGPMPPELDRGTVKRPLVSVSSGSTPDIHTIAAFMAEVGQHDPAINPRPVIELWIACVRDQRSGPSWLSLWSLAIQTDWRHPLQRESFKRFAAWVC